MDWYNKLWSYSVELFRNMEIPVRQLECCSGDLADLKVKSCDIEAWSPRQQKYFEVCSCSNLGDAQAPSRHPRQGRGRQDVVWPTRSTTPASHPRVCSSRSLKPPSEGRHRHHPEVPPAVYGRQGSAGSEALNQDTSLSEISGCGAKRKRARGGFDFPRISLKATGKTAGFSGLSRGT